MRLQIEYLPSDNNHIVGYTTGEGYNRLYQDSEIATITDDNLIQQIMNSTTPLSYNPTNNTVSEYEPNGNKLIITSLTSSDQNAIIDLKNHEITIHENQSVTADFEIHKISDDSLNTDYSGTFRMPLKKQSTGDIVYTLVTISSGKGAITVTLPSGTSGLWQATQELINEKLPPEAKLQFNGLDIYVVI